MLMAVKILPHKFACYRKITLLKCENPVVLYSSVSRKFLETSDGVTAASVRGMTLSSLESQETKELPKIPKWDDMDWITRGA